MWNLISHLVPKLLTWFHKKYEATVCQLKTTTNWYIDDQNLFFTKTHGKNKHVFNDLRGHPQHHLSTCPISNKNSWTEKHKSSLDTTVLCNFDVFSVLPFQKSQFFTGRHVWNHGRSGSDAWYPWLAWSWCLRRRPHHPVTLGEAQMWRCDLRRPATVMPGTRIPASVHRPKPSMRFSQEQKF